MKKLQKPGSIKNSSQKIGIIGVGYVGLPLAVNFSKHFNTVAYDNNVLRIKELTKGFDRNLDYEKNNLIKKKLIFSYDYNQLKSCNVYIITLPTPLNKKNLPNLKMVLSATVKISKIVKRNDFVIFESTFYPGTVEEILIPIIENNSNLKYNEDFYVGYSPERINPGDKKRKLESIKKIVSSNSLLGRKKIKYLYNRIIKAGLFEVKDMKTAE